MIRPYIIGILILTSYLSWAQPYSDPVRSTHVEVELIAEVESVLPGNSFWVGLRMTADPEWHTYWVNPADSGLETTLNWDFPEGFSAGNIQWPYPETFVLESIVSFGFEREILLMVEITPPAEWDEDEVTLSVRADWLECKTICLPGSANLSLTLPVRDTEPYIVEQHVTLFERARHEWPMQDTGWTFEAYQDGNMYHVAAIPPQGWQGLISEAKYYALDAEIVLYGPEQNWRQENGRYRFELQQNTMFNHQPERLRGVLVANRGWLGPQSGRALLVDVAVTEQAVQGAMSARSEGREIGFALALLFAFVGGLILNLMPCVFPVISMKIMGFVQQAEQENSQIFKHGLIFGFGILVSFWVLAGALIALRAGGEQLGWGFHLQSPVFLVAISILFFLLALNLFGVFEVGTSWMGFGQQAASSGGLSGSFFSGAVATLIATPCTAPFMGAALGYALTLSAVQSMTIFSMLGIGMAVPYVLLSAFPKWLSRIPRPGPWMETFKQTVGWIFILVVIYMMKVLDVVAGGPGVMLFVYVATLVGIGGWILGRWGAISRKESVRYTGRVLAALLIGGGTWFGVSGARHLGPVEASDAVPQRGIPWQTFSPELLAELRAEGKPVFINFTAAWCTLCQVNDRIAFSSARVVRAFEEHGVVPLRADWTQRDAMIESVLAGYGRSSIPFYVAYGANASQPTFLPEVLRPGIVIDALENLVQ